jgi:A/G-specific adenine glycosylase
VVLDTNVRRVIGRVLRAEPLPAVHLTRAEHTQAAGLVPADPQQAARWNAAAMELGALVCTSRAPHCHECPVASQCAWFAAGTPGLDAAPRRTQAWDGTDRQVRGKVMALLRAASAPVNVTGHAAVADIEPGQLDRCLASLCQDGLVTIVDADRGTYRL